VRVLFLSPYLPSRIRVRPYHWVRHLARLGHEVHLVALDPPEDAPASPRASRSEVDGEIRRACSAVDVFPLSRARTLLNAVRALPHPGRPLQLAYSHHPGAERWAAGLAASGRYDVVHIEHMRGVALSSRLRGVPIVYDAVDSISTLFAETAKRARSLATRLLARLDLGRSRRFEARAPFLFSRMVVTSQREAAAFVELAGPAARGRLAVVCNGVDTEYFRPAGRHDQRAVVFTGKLSYHANAAAAVRLVERIMPAVWSARPDTPVILAGKDPPADLLALGRDPRVRVTGFVEDIRAIFAEAAVAVCPLVYGAGIQNKVLEALASGVPTVMTLTASRALFGTAGQHYVACEDDHDLAQAIVDLLNDPERRGRLGSEGRSYVVTNHRWDHLAATLVTIYERAKSSGTFYLE
jgi:polysaccharide biosynthesis protein PslH